MTKKFKEPYQTFNEITKLSEQGKWRYINQEIVMRKRSVRDVARELKVSAQYISQNRKKWEKVN